MSDSTKSDPTPWLPDSKDLMEEFLHASTPESSDLRADWLAREALQSIMRLVRAEQLLEIRHSVNRLVPASIRPHSVKRPRRGQRNEPGQTQFAFGRED